MKSFFCAFCKSPRKIRDKRGVTLVEVFYCLVTSLCLMGAIWQNFNAKSIVIFALMVGVLELILQILFRIKIPCPHCGFDPLLYLKSSQRAVDRVQKFLEKRKNDPRVLFSKNPVLNLPKAKLQGIPNSKGGLNPVPATKAKNLDISF